MFRRLARIVFGVLVGTALAYYATSDRGRQTLGRVLDRARQSGLDVPHLAGADGGGRSEATEEAIRAKIEETRRRLKAQLDASAPPDAGETAPPR